MSVRRIAQVIGVKPDDIEEYERIHADVWPTVLATIKKANIQNYSIFRYEHLLFAYMEYTGTDYEKDMATIAADPETQRWWKITDPMQSQVPEARQESGGTSFLKTSTSTSLDCNETFSTSYQR
jgi:L-rhamnose mutarotase